MTTEGFECLSWDNPSADHNGAVPVYGVAIDSFRSTESNFCRNPRFFNFGPWCAARAVPALNARPDPLCWPVPKCPLG